MRPSEALARHRDEVLEIIARYPVSNPRVFGSVARGDDTENSDLDMLVERDGPLDYFQLFALEGELAKLLGCRVEIGTKLKPDAAAHAQNDLRPI
jgi:predicted nucleotidyltransferase